MYLCIIIIIMMMIIIIIYIYICIYFFFGGGLGGGIAKGFRGSGKSSKGEFRGFLSADCCEVW